MKVKVNPDLCIGCTLCVGTCPEVFRMEEDKTVGFVKEVPAQAQDSCRRAAEDCPVTAIGLS